MKKSTGFTSVDFYFAGEFYCQVQTKREKVHIRPGQNKATTIFFAAVFNTTHVPVSYTHLDVYKRQINGFKIDKQTMRNEGERVLGYGLYKAAQSALQWWLPCLLCVTVGTAIWPEINNVFGLQLASGFLGCLLYTSSCV